MVAKYSYALNFSIVYAMNINIICLCPATLLSFYNYASSLGISIHSENNRQVLPKCNSDKHGAFSENAARLTPQQHVRCYPQRQATATRWVVRPHLMTYRNDKVPKTIVQSIPKGHKGIGRQLILTVSIGKDGTACPPFRYRNKLLVPARFNHRGQAHFNLFYQ